MPQKPNKHTRKGKKSPKTATARNLMENFLDIPAKRTRSASGKLKVSANMAEQHDQNAKTKSNSVDKLPIVHEQPVKERSQENAQGFVAGIVQQINNTPNNTPVKGMKVATHEQHYHDQPEQQEQNALENVQMLQTTLPDHFTSGARAKQTTGEKTAMSNTKNSTVVQVQEGDIKQVLADLNTTMKGLQTQLTKMNTTQTENTFKVSTLEFVQKDEVQHMRAAQSKIDKQEQMINMLLNHVSKQDERIQELTSKFNDFQARSMKKNIVVSGIEEKNSEECPREIHNFFQQQLSLNREVPIKVAHRIGSGTNRPIVVKLKNHDDKAYIFQHTQKLRGTSFYVSDQLPEELAENKKQQLRLKGYNKKLPAQEQLTMNIKRDKLFVNNEQYRPAVTVPTALGWLQMTESEQKDIKRTRITIGHRDTQQHSTFISYAATVQSIEDV